MGPTVTHTVPGGQTGAQGHLAQQWQNQGAGCGGMVADPVLKALKAVQSGNIVGITALLAQPTGPS